jgi:hypothetical protein
LTQGARSGKLDLNLTLNREDRTMATKKKATKKATKKPAKKTKKAAKKGKR